MTNPHIFAIADLHLAFGVPEKTMEIFGPAWKSYMANLEMNWKKTIQKDDLVLIAGDISWAKEENKAKIDLDFLHSLPGTKLLLKGNHDYWWSSLSKVKKFLPPSLHLLQNDAFHWNQCSIAGSRLWDTDEYTYSDMIQYIDNPKNKALMEPENPEEQEKIFVRELNRLEMSLKSLKKEAPIKIAMTHYPPIGPQLNPSRASLLLEKFGIQYCVFGHIHNIIPKPNLIGQARGITYLLTAADYLQFQPLQIL